MISQRKGEKRIQIDREDYRRLTTFRHSPVSFILRVAGMVGILAAVLLVAAQRFSAELPVLPSASPFLIFFVGAAGIGAIIASYAVMYAVYLKNQNIE